MFISAFEMQNLMRALQMIFITFDGSRHTLEATHWKEFIQKSNLCSIQNNQTFILLDRLFNSFFLKNGPIPASRCLFSSFPNDSIQISIDKSEDVVLGTQTRCGRMEGSDESTELWRHPSRYLTLSSN